MGFFAKLFGPKQPAPTCEIHPEDKALVRTEDDEWWASLSLADCKLFEKTDNVFLVGALQKFIQNDGLSEEEAAEKVRRQFPFYYWTLEQRAEEHFRLSAADAKLPYVLKDRVNRAVMGGKMNRAKLTSASSMNALIRDLLRLGQT